MIDLRLHVNGTQQIERKLHIAANGISNFSEPLMDIKKAFVRYQREEFKSEGEYGGHPWVELSPRYAAWKQKHFPSKRILEVTGDLRRSLTSELRFVLRPNKLVMWSDSDIAMYHQKGRRAPAPQAKGGGSKLPKGVPAPPSVSGVPRRLIVAIPTGEKRDWVRLLQRHIVYQSGSPLNRGPGL